jgi:hypothetical protein
VSTGSNGSTIEGIKVVVETCLPFIVSRHCESPLCMLWRERRRRKSDTSLQEAH